MKELDRGTLAKIDRKVLAGLGHDEAWQMVRVPAAEAMWAAWKRYRWAVPAADDLYDTYLQELRDEGLLED